jgi:hypothetical protein
MTGPRPVITPQKKIHKTQGLITKSKKIKKNQFQEKKHWGKKPKSIQVTSTNPRHVI